MMVRMYRVMLVPYFQTLVVKMTTSSEIHMEFILMKFLESVKKK